MIGFILAAGFGTRLKPLTDHIPKALVPVCGIPLLQRSISFLSDQGIRNLAVNTHYLPDQIYSFRDSSPVPFEIFHEKDTIRGTGGALHFAKEFLTSEELFCVINADVLSNVSIDKLIKQFQASDSIGMLIAAPPAGKGTIFFHPESMVYCGIPADITGNSPAVGADFIGMAVYKRKIFDFISEEDFSIIPVWKRVIEREESIIVAVEDDIYWRDTGTPSALARIHFNVLEQSLDISVPNHMHVDHARKIAYPETLSQKAVSSLQAFTWTDSDDIASTADISHSVIFNNAVVRDGELITRVLLTQWGGIPFEY